MESIAYFDILHPDDIRIKGTRIGIETILYAHIHQQQSAEDIAQTYPQLTLEQIYATILYYHQHPTEISQYLTNWLNHCTQAEKEQDQNPSAMVSRLKQLKAEKMALAHG
jgi:uncharacterized protein (DUF433 family)